MAILSNNVRGISETKTLKPYEPYFTTVQDIHSHNKPKVFPPDGYILEHGLYRLEVSSIGKPLRVYR